MGYSLWGHKESDMTESLSTAHIYIYIYIYLASLVVWSVENPPNMQETRVQFLGWKEPLEKKIAPRSSILAWRIQWTEEPGRR